MAIKQNNTSINKVKNIITWPIRIFRKLSRKAKIVTLIILALLVFWRINAYRNSGLEVSVEEVKYDKILESVNVSGEVAAENSAVLSFQTTGEVTEVNFKEGDTVNKSDVIAKLNTSQLYYNYQSAKAALRSAEASLDSVYDQLQGHKENETFAQRSTRTTAEAAKDSAYWTFAAASKNLEGAYVKAPFNGIITQAPQNIVPGSFVSLPTSFVYQIVDPDTTYFRCGVNEIDINKLKGGLKTEIQIDAYPDEMYEGEVMGFNFASSLTSTGATAFAVRITLPENDSLKFKPGMKGDVDIIISEKDNILTVPITAVVENDDESYVWINENGTAKKRSVTTGVSSINKIEIVSGLDAGESIITRPPIKTEEGLKLKIVK